VQRRLLKVGVELSLPGEKRQLADRGQSRAEDLVDVLVKTDVGGTAERYTG